MSLLSWAIESARGEKRGGPAAFAAEQKRRYSAVFDTEDGRWVLADMCNSYGVFDQLPPVDAQGVLDSHMLAFLEGRRSAVVNILKLVKLPLIEEGE